MAKHLFNYKWNLSDGYPESHGLKVFGTFISGGGSTMGYKLAGFKHLGGVEIDPQVAKVYERNHKPLFMFNEDIRAFNRRDDLPSDLFDLDILDGSPPCSSFSLSGSREKNWGKQKQFREGQAMQQLDDLVFVYCDTILKLQPKTFILENVKGIIQGNAKAYCKKIVEILDQGGYNIQVFLLNAASMGVPQRRERVFFIGHKKTIQFKRLNLKFNEKPIPFGHVKIKNCQAPECFIFPKSERERLALVRFGDRNLVNADKKIRGADKNAFFNQTIIYDNQVMGTITAQEKSFVYDEKRRLSNLECCMLGSYPMDYDFMDINPKYLIGMSVPPVMTAQISNQMFLQWFNNKN